jgi:hypothetical protein
MTDNGSGYVSKAFVPRPFVAELLRQLVARLAGGWEQL